jgi:hypothetical protein
MASRRQSSPMSDIVMLLVVAAFFILSAGFVTLCDRV